MKQFFDVVLCGNSRVNNYKYAKEKDWNIIPTTNRKTDGLSYVDEVGGVCIWWEWESNKYYFSKI